MHSQLEREFPNLRTSPYRITSSATPEYNCIAWAAGDKEAWWWPDANEQAYWPSGVPRVESLPAFIKAFQSLGYEKCDFAELEIDCEKVAIFTDETGKPTHASRQEPDGSWTSKLGQWIDIEHALEGVSGSRYGAIAVIMKRKASTA